MSSLSRLNNLYGRFFKKAAYFSVSPYSLGFMAGRLITGGHMPDDPAWEAQVNKNGYFIAITLTVIPLLPVLTAITIGLALLGAALAALSTLLTYPVTAALDCAMPEDNHRNNYAS